MENYGVRFTANLRAALCKALPQECDVSSYYRGGLNPMGVDAKEKNRKLSEAEKNRLEKFDVLDILKKIK